MEFRNTKTSDRIFMNQWTGFLHGLEKRFGLDEDERETVKDRVIVFLLQSMI
jgi:hypothetical protein